MQGDISAPTFIIKMIHDILGETSIKLRFRLDGSLFDVKRLKAKSKTVSKFILEMSSAAAAICAETEKETQIIISTFNSVCS